MDVTTTKNFAILDLSKRTIQIQPTIKFTKDLISLQILPKHEDNKFKFDHTASTSGEVNRKILKKYGYLNNDELRTNDSITTDRCSTARASAEYLSSDANCCGAHFAFTNLSDALKNSAVPLLTLLLSIMQAICRITRYSSLSIPCYVQVTRLWKAYFFLCETLLAQKEDVTNYIHLQSVLHNLACVESCFLKLSEELEWQNNDI